MHIISVNIGVPAPFPATQDKTIVSGIVKTPVDTPVKCRRNGLEGDDQADNLAHKELYRAVCAYPAEHYRAWIKEETLNDLTFGIFGENITIEDCSEENVMVGDRFRVGSTLLEVTYPRIPCIKLAMRMGDPTFPDRFLASGRTGFFFQVIEAGLLCQGDAMIKTAAGAGNFSISETLELFYGQRRDPLRLEEISKLDALPFSWRKKAASMVSKLT